MSILFYSCFSVGILSQRTFSLFKASVTFKTYVVQVVFAQALSAIPSTQINTKPSNTPYVYPVPYVKGKNTSLTFSNLVPPSKIEIYSVDGVLLHEKEVDAPTYSFVPDSFASGVYVYLIKNSKGTTSGKLVIIR